MSLLPNLGFTNIFSHCGLPFNSLNGVFWWTKGFSFNEVQFIDLFPLGLVLFVLDLRKLFSCPRSCNYSLMLSLGSANLAFTFTSTIYRFDFCVWREVGPGFVFKCECLINSAEFMGEKIYILSSLHGSVLTTDFSLSLLSLCLAYTNLTLSCPLMLQN